jgi:glycosyltransferase involved in cell wall biosynthesis
MSPDRRAAPNLQAMRDAGVPSRQEAAPDSPPDRTPHLSLVLPARNERECLGPMLAEVARVLQPCAIDYEVIVVDDGSVDGTFESLRELARSHPRLRGIRLSRSFGKESALLAGLVEASGEAVVTLDADLQHPPAIIPDMLACWRGGARIVQGVKRGALNTSGPRHLLSAAYNRLARALSGLQLHGASDFVLLDRTVVDVITRDMPERRRFHRAFTRWVGFPQASVEFDVGARVGGGTRWSLRGLLDLGMTGLFAFSSLPLRLLTIFGLISLVISLVIAALAISSWIGGQPVPGVQALEILLLFLGSAILIGLGIVGEYVGCIYDEIKRRPAYLVSERLGPQSVRARGAAIEAPVMDTGSR